jgi:hypothetical protein
VRTGAPSLVPAQNNITRNLLFNSYSSTWPLDHDDGSCYYTDTENFMVYGGYKNFLGHSKTVRDNVYVHPSATRPGRLRALSAFHSRDRF